MDPRVKITPEVQQIFTLTTQAEDRARTAGAAYKEARELLAKVKAKAQSAANEALAKQLLEIAPEAGSGPGRRWTWRAWRIWRGRRTAAAPHPGQHRASIGGGGPSDASFRNGAHRGGIRTPAATRKRRTPQLWRSGPRSKPRRPGPLRQRPRSSNRPHPRRSCVGSALQRRPKFERNGRHGGHRVSVFRSSRCEGPSPRSLHGRIDQVAL